MLDPACLDAIQPLLRKGLTKYFSDEDMEITQEELDNYLFLETATSSMRSRPTRPACPNSRFPTPTSSRT